MSCIQDSPDQCPMPINTDQCQSKFWHWSQCWSIPINADPAFTLELALVICGPSENKGALIGIERNWSALIGIERHFRSMPWFWSALGIDRGSPVYSSLQLCNLTIIRGRTDAATYVCLETTPWKRGLQWQVFFSGSPYYRVVISLYAWQLGWEPHWQGASLVKSHFRIWQGICSS